MKALRLMLMLAPLLAMGCGDENKQLSPSDFTTEYAKRVCDGVSSACLIPATSCTAGQLSARALVDQAAVGAGRVFMSANAEVCLAKVNAVYGQLKQHLIGLTAADLQGVQDSCADVYRGLRVARGPCAVDQDCVSGLICDASKGTPTGMCAVKSEKVEGVGCANLGETCAPGFYCSNSTGVLACEARPGLAAACSATTPCLETLRCAAGICVAQLELGNPCTTDQDCSTGLCEPYAHKCADDVRYAQGTPACQAMGGL
jgi:hypothetical protein